MIRSSRWWIVSILALWAHPAHAGNWSLGTNLGVSVLQPKGGGDNLTVLGVPGTVGQFVPGFQPGLRLGVLGEGGKGEVDVDLGVSSLTASGETYSTFQGTLNLQRNFSPSASTSPFATIGAGGLFLSGGGDSFSNFVAGGGIGLQHRLSSGHGALRGEVRIDYITEDQEGFEGGVVFALKLGFDLWMH